MKRPSAPCGVGTARADRPHPCRACPCAPRRSAQAGCRSASRRGVWTAGLARAGRAGATRARRFFARAGFVRRDRRRRPGFGRASRSIGVSVRCSRGSVTRGVRVDRVGAKLRHRVSRSREVQASRQRKQASRPETEAPGGIAGRPLARETSAGAAWKPPCVVREDRTEGGSASATRIQRSVWRMGPQPHPGLCSKPSASWARHAGDYANRGSGDPWLCSWVVLVAEVDERRLVRALTRSGLVTRPRARVVKGRRKPARGGEAAGAVAGSL